MQPKRVSDHVRGSRGKVIQPQKTNKSYVKHVIGAPNSLCGQRRILLNKLNRSTIKGKAHMKKNNASIVISLHSAII